MTTDQRELPAASRWSVADSVLISAITFVGTLVRAIRLGTPAGWVFDESYYARDACFYVHQSVSLCGTGVEANFEHPPLAKWLIALGIQAFGYRPLAWRLPSLIAGALTIALLYLLARKLLGSTLGAAVASGLMAIDIMHLVHSRIGMLDAIVVLFIVAAFVFLVYDRDRIIERSSGIRWWRLAAGAACGAAIATKWSGGFNLAAAIALSLAWEIWARRDRGRLHAIAGTLREQGAGMAVAFVVVPLIVYALAHVGRVHGDLIAAPWSETSWLNALWDRQFQALHRLLELSVVNPYQSSPWSWLLLKRGIPYRLDPGPGSVAAITSTGSPIVWWSSILAILYVAARWVRKNDPRRPEGTIVAGVAFNLLPWVVFASAPFLFLLSGRSAVYIFYALPLEPFMFIAIALVAQRIAVRAWGKVAIVAFGVAAVASFAFLYPIATYVRLDDRAYSARLWIFDECDKPDRYPATIIQVTSESGQPVSRTFRRGRNLLAPEGWCWTEPPLLNRDLPELSQPEIRL